MSHEGGLYASSVLCSATTAGASSALAIDLDINLRCANAKFTFCSIMVRWEAMSAFVAYRLRWTSVIFVQSVADVVKCVLSQFSRFNLRKRVVGDSSCQLRVDRYGEQNGAIESTPISHPGLNEGIGIREYSNQAKFDTFLNLA
jgi:hypothetical protein